MESQDSLTRWPHEMHSADPAHRDEAARLIRLRFTERLRAVMRRRLDPRIRHRAGEDDALQSLFASFFATAPGPDSPPRSRAELWRILVHFTLCKMANTADRHRARRLDVRRDRPLEAAAADELASGPANVEPEDPRRLGPEATVRHHRSSRNDPHRRRAGDDRGAKESRSSCFAALIRRPAGTILPAAQLSSA